MPHVRQKPDFCGEACAEMYLRKLGHQIDQDDVFNQSGVDPALARGCITKDMARALPRIGFDVGAVWFSVDAERAEAELPRHFQALHADLLAGVPSIVCMHYDDQPETTEHFRLVLGYDAETDEVLYHEPAIARGAYRRMPREELLKLWPLKYDEDRWTLVRFRLNPVAIRRVQPVDGFSNADWAQHLIRLKKKLPEGFNFVIEKPFVVIGDESPEDIRRWASGTIRWSIDRLKRLYFKQDPHLILDIWLFKDEESYNKYVKEVFGEEPHTPFGYYSRRHRALIMNIATGGGTLVHEIVHPFIESNFPECPSWFNEGLASLYEQSGEYRGHIWGRTNWRLKGLQRAIEPPKDDDDEDAKKKKEEPKDETAPPPELPSFKTLCETTTREFYREDPGTNYAQARYLCYYLQQRGLLARYYHQFRRDARDDPSGYGTLKSVLGVDEEDMGEFQERWEAWIMELRFP